MLSFHQVIDNRLKAVIHIDGTARVQTVSYQDNTIMYNLLLEFKKLSGASALCNTSLNFKGRGFINSDTDLESFLLEQKHIYVCSRSNNVSHQTGLSRKATTNKRLQLPMWHSIEQFRHSLGRFCSYLHGTYIWVRCLTTNLRVCGGTVWTSFTIIGASSRNYC